MNIFVVVPRLAFGGAERVAVAISNGLSRKGHSVTILADTSPLVAYPVDEAVRIIDIQPKSGNKLQRHLLSVLKIRKHVRRLRPDVVIGIMWASSLKARVATCGMGIPVISTVHDAFEHPASAPMSRFERFVKFQLNKIYPYVTVLTRRDQEVIGKRLRHVRVMPNPLFLEPVNEVPPKTKMVLAVGRLGSWHYKGFDILIEAWAKIEDKAGWQLHIVGDGNQDDVERMRGFIDKAGVSDCVILHPFTTDIVSFYRQAGVFVLSSRYEGFGLVLIEAMSQGCACVAADYLGRQRDIITDGVDGLICPTENTERLSVLIRQLMKDDALRSKLQKHAISSVKQFELSSIADRWDNFLSQMLEKNCL